MNGAVSSVPPTYRQSVPTTGGTASPSDPTALAWTLWTCAMPSTSGLAS